MAILSDTKARKIKPTEKSIGDGAVVGLRLHPGKVVGHGKWFMRFNSPKTNKRREMGFGSYPEISILEARKTAAAARELIRSGTDPIDAREYDKQARQIGAKALTFELAARQYHADHKPGWKNKKHAAQWIASIETYVFPKIGLRKVASLKVGSIMLRRPSKLLISSTRKKPPEELYMVMQSYIDQLKTNVDKTNRLREEKARAKRPPADPRIVCKVPLKQQVQEYLLSQPPIMRNKPLSLMALRAQLQGRYNSRPSVGDLGIVLTALGFKRVRDYTKEGGCGRRYWLPPTIKKERCYR